MRGAMPSSDSVLFLLGSVAMQITETTYARPIAIFKDWIPLFSSYAPSYGAKKSPSLGAWTRTTLHTFSDTTSCEFGYTIRLL